MVANEAGLVVNYCQFAASTVMIYDFILTTSQEVHYFWQRKTTPIAVLFYFNRYATLAFAIIQIFAMFPWTDYASCVAMNVVTSCVLFELLYIPWAAFSSIRVWAVSNRSWFLTAVVGGLAIASFIGDTILSTTVYFTRVPSAGLNCTMYYRYSQTQANRETITIRVLLIVSDLLALLTMIHYTPTEARTVTSMSISAKFLKQGIQYFVVALVLNILDVVLFCSNVFYDFAPFFATPLTSIMISRGLLSLRHTSEAHHFQMPGTETIRLALEPSTEHSDSTNQSTTLEWTTDPEADGRPMNDHEQSLQATSIELKEVVHCRVQGMSAEV